MLQNDKCDFIYKIVLVGDPCVGKTNIISKFVTDEFFENNRPTYGIDIVSKTVTVKDKLIKTQLWDTAGQERYRAIANAFYRMATGIIIIFDITNKNTFDHLEMWLNNIKLYEKNAHVLIIGNKLDLENVRVVAHDDAKAFCSKHGYSYVETSAKDNININYAFTLMLEEIIDSSVGSFEEYNKEYNSDNKDNSNKMDNGITSSNETSNNVSDSITLDNKQIDKNNNCSCQII